MTQLLDLLSLPANVFSEISSFLGSVKEIVRLDSAYCPHHFREKWLQLLESKHIALHCPVDISKRDVLSWVLKKSVRCKSLQFNMEIEEYKLIADFLREAGDSIRTVEFYGRDNTKEMFLVALYCKNLTSLRLVDTSLGCEMREIMLRNPNLQEIHCTNVNCSDIDIFAEVSLHKLTSLHIERADCWQGFPWHETAFSDSLRKFVLVNSEYDTTDIEPLFANCPALRIFGSNCITSGEHDTIFLNGSLEELNLCDNDTLTDAHVLSFLKRLPSLTRLAVQNCKLLTDASLQYITDYVGSQLEKLRVDIKHPERAETEAILDVFSQKCTKLEYLSVDCGDKVLCHGKGTSLLVRGCPGLRTLVVNKYSTITASSRGLIEYCRPDLCIQVGNPPAI